MERKEDIRVATTGSKTELKPGVPIARSGIWRSLGGIFQTPRGDVNHREEYTPLLSVAAFPLPAETRLWLKVESRNPTGSAHDRGMAAVVTNARSTGVKTIQVCASPAACTSLAAFAAGANIETQLQFTSPAPAIIRAECLAYGARFARSVSTGGGGIQIVGDSSDSSLLDIWKRGLGTIASEVLEQLGGVLPAAVVIPGGDDLLCSALEEAFNELARTAASAVRPIVHRADFAETAASECCLRLARAEGLLTSLATGSALAALNHLKLPEAASVVIVDSLAPKFSGDLSIPGIGGAREESKLGGLITPR